MKQPLNSEMLVKAKRRNLWAFMFGNLIAGFGDSCINIAFMPFLYEVTNYNLFLTGILTTTSMIMWFFPAPILGMLSDKFGRKKMMILSGPVASVGVFLLLFVNQNNLYLLIISNICRSVGFFSATLNYNFLVSDSNEGSKNGLGNVFGIMSFLFFVSTIGGAIFVNRTGYTYQTYFAIFLAIYLFNWLKNILFITDTKANIVNSKKIVATTSQKKDWRELLKNPKVQVAVIFFTLDILFWDISNSVLTAGLQSQYGFTLEDLAFFSIWFNVSCMLFQIPCGKLTDKLGIKTILTISEIGGFFIFSLHIAAWASGNATFVFTAMIIIQVLLGIVVSTFIPSESMILTDLDSNKKGVSYGMVSFIRGFGAMPTGIIGGFLMGRVHFIAPFIVTLLGIILLVIYLWKYGHRFEEIKETEIKESH